MMANETSQSLNGFDFISSNSNHAYSKSIQLIFYFDLNNIVLPFFKCQVFIIKTFVVNGFDFISSNSNHAYSKSI